MQIGFVGLGKMGSFMVERLLRDRHEVVAWNRSAAPLEKVVALGGRRAASLKELVAALAPPRAVWLMVPAGDAVTQMIDELAPLLSRNDIIVDGGNSNYKDSARRAAALAARGLRFADCGTSGGVWGLSVGYCLMVGAEPDVFKVLEPVFKSLAPPDGYARMGGPGAGHLVKMVHNGIEYGMMQAYAEGFDILKASPYGLDLPRIAHLWNQGSVVRSWLLELAQRALEEDPDLAKIQGFVSDSGEGRWTIQEAIDRDVPAPVITLSLFERFHSRRPESFAAKLLAALRNQFGGHAVKPR
jgi:6-phosphogluconate dehydrogenase